MTNEQRAGVIVVGAGNAGMSATHAARERGCDVVVLEKADPEWSGGNSAFTAGAIRGVVVRDADGLRRTIGADAVVLAAGGFESDPQMRAAHLGPNWDVAKVRGTPHDYPGGSGVTAAAVFGRRAGYAAAA